MIINLPKSSKSVTKNRKSMNSNNDSPKLTKLLSIPKVNKNFLCLSPKSGNRNNNVSTPFNISLNNISFNNNISLMKNNGNFNEKVEQYKLHPHRRINLKLVGEGIKQKLIKMNEENDIYEQEKMYSSPESRNGTHLFKNKYSIEMSNNIDISHNSIMTEIEFPQKGKNTNIVKSPNLKLTEHKNELFNKRDKSNSCENLIKIQFPIYNNKRTKQKDYYKNTQKDDYKIEKDFSFKKKRSNNTLNIHRIVKRKNILYDSMDDNESEEDIGGIVINPEKKFIFYFDLLIIIFYLYSFVITTNRIAQIECFCSYNDYIFNDIILYLTDIIYLLDLVISFFRGFYNFQYKLTLINSLIIKNYLKRDFFLDLLEAIPIFSINRYICYKNREYYNCYKYEMPSIFFFIITSSIIKTLKITKILGRKKNQVLDNFLELISENYTFERTVLLLIDSLMFIGIFHCFICYYIFLGAHSYPNWIIKTNAENESFFSIYIESFYFLVTTITTVGYGDITCSSFGERIFHIFLLAIGSIFYSYIISTIGNYIKNDSNAKIQYNNDLTVLENIRVANRNMPFKLYKNIRKYLESKSSSQAKYDINSLIDGLPFTLKNAILFTMYKIAIKNFKFFKKNDNSEFIAQVLTNFILVISKRNEFLVYEGEMLDEIIFIKDGRISINAAIDLIDPTKSIYTYFNEKFNPFNSDEEKKLYESQLNDYNIKSGFVSTMNAEISYDTALLKINKAFKTLKNKNSDEKSVFAINNQNNNNEEEKKDINDLYKFDLNGGTIKNEDGNYQYLKILDIRKNEHFGVVFMTLKRPCPLSLQVKSKFAEIYLLKKEEAVSISKDYANIWKKLYMKEFHNLRAIKNLTFSALRKYIEINQLLLDLNIDDDLGKNDLTLNDLNELEKSLYYEKSMISPFQNSKKNIIPKKQSSKKVNFTKFKTMNSDFEKKMQRLSIGKIHVDCQKDKFSFRKKFKGRGFSNSIIYNNSENLLQLGNNNLFFSNKRNKQKLVHFVGDNVYSKSSKNERVNNNNPIMKKVSSSELFTTEDHESEKGVGTNRNKTKKEKLKKLKKLLINCQKKLKIKQYEENESKMNANKEKNNNNDNNPSNYQARKGILKEKNNKKRKSDIKYTINLIKDNKVISNLVKNVDSSNINNKNNNDDSNEDLINDIKNYLNEETDFSFCTVNNERNFNLDELNITHNINLEIISSYSNFNQLSKGKFITDIEFQKKIKLGLKEYYSNKALSNYSLSSKSIGLYTSSEVFSNNNLKNLKNHKDISKKNLKKYSQKKSIQKIYKYNTNKHKIKENSGKDVLTHTQKKNLTDIKNNKNKEKKISSSNENKLSNNISYKKDISNNSNQKNTLNNFTFYPSISEQNSIKANLSDNDIFHNSSSFSKEITKKKSYKHSPIVNIKKNKKIFNNSETEFEINKTFNKSSIYSNNNPINNIHTEKRKYSNNSIKKNCNNKNKNKNNDNNGIINQILGIQIPNTQIITNNITTISSNNNNNDNFNTNEKINNIEASFSIYNIIQKNINKNLGVVGDKEKIEENKLSKNFCIIY